MEETEWQIEISQMASRTFNPIRQYLECVKLEPNPDKHMIALSIGDPTAFGNLMPNETIVNALVDSARSAEWHGYQPSTGNERAREAVANYVSAQHCNITSKDVIISSGCSMSLDLCISVLADPGDNILVPKPGFPLYRTLASGIGVASLSYNLKHYEDWQVDLDHLQSLINTRTRAIVVNNPSNPCGAVYSRQHLLDILRIAETHHLPIIADEIYNNFVFEGHQFHYMGSLGSHVPVLSCGGLTKRFLVPGWRLGWITIHDKNNVLRKVRQGLPALCQRIMGANSVVQGALSDILALTECTFFQHTIRHIQENAEVAFTALSRVRGLNPVRPQGAMYMMVGIQMEKFACFKDDTNLIEALVREQSVFPLPGQCFDCPNFVRIVLTLPVEQMKIACDRLACFFNQHFSDI